MESSNFNIKHFRSSFEELYIPRNLEAHLVQDGKICYTNYFSLSKGQLAELLYLHFRHEAYASLQREKCDLEIIKAKTVSEAISFFKSVPRLNIKRFELDEDEVWDLQKSLLGEKDDEKDLTADDLNRFYDEVQEREYLWWYQPTRRRGSDEDDEDPQDFYTSLHRDHLYQWMIKTFKLTSVANAPDAKVHYDPEVVKQMEEYVMKAYREAYDIIDGEAFLANLKEDEYTVVVDIDDYLSEVHEALMIEAHKSKWTVFKEGVKENYGCVVNLICFLAFLGGGIWALAKIVITLFHDF